MQNDVKNMPEELQDFNWAAFLLTFIWGIRFKAWITLLALPLIIIQLPYGINWLLLIFFQLYCGTNGNKWAYYNEYWKKSKDFRITQMKWAAAGLTFYIVTPIILLSICTRFLKNIDNLPELIKNAQCTKAYKFAKKDLKTVSLSGLMTSTDIIRQISKNYKSAQNNEYSITTNSTNFMGSYTIRIDKSNDEICSFNEKNCTIEYSFYLKNYTEYPNNCTFYFNNSKSVEPDQKTQTAIKKGTNILKYL